jgi:5-methylcytosine-specific restriction endonuclease McrA
MSYFDSCKIFYKSKFWKELAKSCKERDNYICQKCRKSAETASEKRQLHAHHKISRRPVPHPTGLDKLENLVCICNACHSFIHKRNLTGKSIPNAPPKLFKARNFKSWKNF